MDGIGVLIQRLGGNAETVAAYQRAIGKTIASAALTDDDALVLTFTDGSGVRFTDEGQSCCESRYMRTDDTLAEYVGAVFTGAELKDAPNQTGDDDWGDHEVQFLEVQTSKGVFTMASHNEHNGYYGGFCVVMRTLPEVAA